MVEIPSQEEYIVVLASDKMGQGNDELGQVLMKSFLSVLVDQELKPAEILLYNTGAKLAIEDSEVIEDLKSLEASGSHVKTCGTCLDYFGIKDQLAVGEVSNMKAIFETMRSYSQLVRP